MDDPRAIFDVRDIYELDEILRKTKNDDTHYVSIIERQPVLILDLNLK